MKGELTREMEIHNATKRKAFMIDNIQSSNWSFAITMDGRPQINKPGWEITEVVPNVFQAIAISSRFRFTGHGNTPQEAMERALSEMLELQNELDRHIAAC